MQFQIVQPTTAYEQDIDLPQKNPARVAAGRINALRRSAWTEQQREDARQRARKHRPWRSSTGPKTPQGKRRAANNRLAAARRRLLLLVARGDGTVHETADAALLLLRATLLKP